MELDQAPSGGEAREGESGNGVESGITGAGHKRFIESLECDEPSVQDATDVTDVTERVSCRGSPTAEPDAASNN